MLCYLPQNKENGQKAYSYFIISKICIIPARGESVDGTMHTNMLSMALEDLLIEWGNNINP